MRYWQPLRRWVVALAGRLPDSRLRDGLIDWLYPDDAEITFPSEARVREWPRERGEGGK